MNQNYSTFPNTLKKWGMLLCFLIGTYASIAQTFYRTYISPSAPTATIGLEETSNGFRLSGNGYNFLTDSNVFIELETDGDGNKLSDQETSIPNNGSNVTSNLLQLADGTFLTAKNSAFGDPGKALYTRYAADGSVLDEFEIAFPAGAGILSRPALLQLPNGNLYTITGYSEDNPSGPPSMRHFVFAEYDLDNQQFVFINDLLWSTNTIRADVQGLKLGSDGKLIVYIYEPDFINRHYIAKHELDGTQIWRSTVSSLERPVADFAPTPEGGVWEWNGFFNTVRYLNPDGSNGGSFDLFSFQNSIQGPATVRGIAATSDNGLLVIGTANPSAAPGTQVFTALVSGDGSTLQTHLFDLPDPLPTVFSGVEVSGGGFAFSGGLLTGAIGTVPFLLRLNADGNLENPVSTIDLDINMTGSTPIPDIWSLHTVSLSIKNDGNETATGVVVSIPQTAGSVYQGGNEYTASQGTFHPFGSQEWNVGTLTGGASANITINYFRTSNDPLFQYAQVVASDQVDFDSEPNNGDGLMVNEDDESIYGGSSVDFQLGFVNVDIEAASVGGNFEFSYTALATYPLSEFETTISNAFYLSVDDTYSSDDLLLSNSSQTFNTTTTQNETVSLQIPSSIPPGDYFLVGRLDDPNQYNEPNEDNNVSSNNSNRKRVIITPPAPTLPDLVCFRPNGVNPQGGYDIGDNIAGASTDLFNTGVATNGTTIDIRYYLSTDQNFDANDILIGERAFSPTQILHFSPQFLSAPTLSVPAGTPGGQYWILIYIDFNDDIVEATESNNVRASYNQIFINGSNNPCSPDVTLPNINNCPADISLTTTNSSSPVNWTAPSADDSCPGAVSLTSNFNPGDTFPLGTTTVTYTATDASNNQAQCSFTVTITQTPPPGTCSNNLLQNGGFENGLTGWNILGGGELTNEAFSGNNAIKVFQGPDSRAFQAVPVTAGEQYHFEFTAKNDATNGQIGAGVAYVKFLTANWQPISSGPFLGLREIWLTLSNDYIAPPNAAYAEINFASSSSYSVIADDVCFSQSTNPTDCNITVQATNIQCQDNGTPNDPADDTFTFDVIVNNTGSCGSTWSAPNRVGQYGVAATFGPYAIANNLVRIDFRDQANPVATAQLEVIAPAPCSNGSGPQADLLLSDLQAPASGQTGDVINYTFDLSNDGNANASGAFSVKAYFSTDAILSTDDVFDGLVPTGNLAANTTVEDVPGASTIPSGLAAGNYFLILKADADEQIAESDENNNTIAHPITISTGGGNPNCSASSDFPWHDWISNVSVGSVLDQNSGKSFYSDFTGSSFPLDKGSTQTITLRTSFSYFTYDEYWRVWIDLNGDDSFDASEIVFEGIAPAPADGTPSTSISGDLSIPNSASSGPAKMRVIMSRGGYAGPCGTIDFGEVEDYLVNLIGTDPNFRTDSADLLKVSLFPNPASTLVSVVLGNKNELAEELVIINQFGKVVYVQAIEEAVGTQQQIEVDLSEMVNGNYFLQVRGPQMRPVSKRLMIQNTY